MASAGLKTWDCFCLLFDSGAWDDEGGFEVYSKEAVRFFSIAIIYSADHTIKLLNSSVPTLGFKSSRF